VTFVVARQPPRGWRAASWPARCWPP